MANHRPKPIDIIISWVRVRYRIQRCVQHNNNNICIYREFEKHHIPALLMPTPLSYETRKPWKILVYQKERKGGRKEEKDQCTDPSMAGVDKIPNVQKFTVTTCRYHRRRRAGHRHQTSNARNCSIPPRMDCYCRSHSLWNRTGHASHYSHTSEHRHKKRHYIAVPVVCPLASISSGLFQG